MEDKDEFIMESEEGRRDYRMVMDKVKNLLEECTSQSKLDRSMVEHACLEVVLHGIAENSEHTEGLDEFSYHLEMMLMGHHDKIWGTYDGKWDDVELVISSGDQSTVLSGRYSDIAPDKEDGMHEFGDNIATIPLLPTTPGGWPDEGYECEALAQCRMCGISIIVGAQIEDGNLMCMTTGGRPDCKNKKCQDNFPARVFAYWFTRR